MTTKKIVNDSNIETGVDESIRLTNLINERIFDYRDTEMQKDDNKKNKGGKKVLEIDRIYAHFKLHDRVVAFYDGREWNIISLNFMLKHPIMYYKHWSDKHSVYYENSLFVCPLTLRSMVYKGKVRVARIDDGYEVVLQNTETDDVFPISNPYTGHYDELGQQKTIKSHVKRHEVKLIEHRDIFAFDSDPTYVIAETNDDYIIDADYYNNRSGVPGYGYDGQEQLSTTLHPKSLVYVVQYYSKTDNAYRHRVLISYVVNRDEVAGYEYRKSRVWKYTEENKDNLIEKKAFTYPMLWFAIDAVNLTNYTATVLA